MYRLQERRERRDYGNLLRIRPEHQERNAGQQPESKRYAPLVELCTLSAGRSPSIRPPVESGKPARRDGGYPRSKNCSPLEAMKEIINPNSLKVLTNCYVEKFLADSKPLDYLQFQRIGYFNVDKDSTVDKLVFNRTVSLKDTWSKVKDK